MSLGHGASVVREGLVLHLDAANVKSYPGSGTTWNDLSGLGNNGTLVNGTSFSDGSIVLDGVDDYVSVSNPETLNPGTSSFSIDCWIYQKDTGYNGVIEARATGLHGFLLIVNYPATGTCSLFLNTTLDSSQNVYQSSVSTFGEVDKWINVAVVVNRSTETINFYKNGIKQGNSITVTSGGSTDPLSGYRYHIGGDLGGPEANMNVSSIRHYNRALTMIEISQNFEANRGRYGI